MTKFKFRPSLESMDERIVPDATVMNPPTTELGDAADPAPQAAPPIPPPQPPGNPQNNPKTTPTGSEPWVAV